MDEGGQRGAIYDPGSFALCLHPPMAEIIPNSQQRRDLRRLLGNLGRFLLNRRLLRHTSPQSDRPRHPPRGHDLGGPMLRPLHHGPRLALPRAAKLKLETTGKPPKSSPTATMAKSQGRPMRTDFPRMIFTGVPTFVVS